MKKTIIFSLLIGAAISIQGCFVRQLLVGPYEYEHVVNMAPSYSAAVYKRPLYHRPHYQNHHGPYRYFAHHRVRWAQPSRVHHHSPRHNYVRPKPRLKQRTIRRHYNKQGTLRKRIIRRRYR